MQSNTPLLVFRIFIGICVVLLVFSFFLWPDQDNFSTINATNQRENCNTIGAETPLIEKLVGKVIYQRPDGIHLIRIGDTVSQRLVDYGTNPRWSPDGKRIAFVHGNAIKLFTGKSREIKHLATANQAKALCFSPDGQSVIFTDNDVLRQVAISNGKITTLLKDSVFYEVDIT